MNPTAENPYAAPNPAALPPLVANVILDERSVSVEFELEMPDILAWSMYYHRTGATSRRQIRIVILMLILAAALCSGLAVLDLDKNFAWLALAATFLVLAVLFPFFFRWRIRQQITRMYREGSSLNLVGPRKLTLTPEYLVYASPISQTTMRWVGVDEIVRTPSELFVKLSSIQAIVVPRRAFGSDTQFAQFCQAAEDYRKSAKMVHV
jgi:hypothetical protein